MKKLLLLSAALVLGTGLVATADMSDNFDSYADKAAFDAVWTPTSGGGMLLITDQPVPPVSPPNMIYQTTAALQSRRAVAPVAAGDLYFKFDFYDERGTGSLARTYGMAYGRGGAGAWTDGLTQIIAVGKYNGIATTKYSARVAFGSSNWFNLDLGPDRTVGWHTAEVFGNLDTATYDFYIDGIFSGSAPMGNQGVVFNWAVMGSGLTSTHGMYFDNVFLGEKPVEPIPEPMSMALAGLGLAAVGAIRRRRS